MQLETPMWENKELGVTMLWKGEGAHEYLICVYIEN